MATTLFFLFIVLVPSLHNI